jgi:hypothetical protein
MAQLRLEAMILVFGLLGDGALAAAGAQDADGDGVRAVEDCDDADPAVHPGAAEDCDGVDQDCDGEVDEDAGTTWFVDADGDGWGDWNQRVQACAASDLLVRVTDRAGDCDDSDGAVGPHAREIPANGIDEDCDGVDGPAVLAATSPAG